MTYVLYVGRKKVGEAKSLKTARAKAYGYLQKHPPLVVYVIDKEEGSAKGVKIGNVQVKGGEIIFDGGKGKYAVNEDGSLSVAKGKPSKSAPKVFKSAKVLQSVSAPKRPKAEAYDWRKDPTTFGNIMPPDKSKGKWVIVLTNDRLFGDTGSNVEGIVQRDGETVLTFDANNPHKSLGGALRYTDQERKNMHRAIGQLNKTLSSKDRSFKLYAERIMEVYTPEDSKGNPKKDKKGKPVRLVRFKTIGTQSASSDEGRLEGL